MPSRKGLEQALTWLKSKMAEKDTLDAINAEVAYNVILDLKDKRQVIGALYHDAYTAKKKAQERLQEIERDRLYESAIKAMHRYGQMTEVEMTQAEIEDAFGVNGGEDAG